MQKLIVFFVVALVAGLAVPFVKKNVIIANILNDWTVAKDVTSQNKYVDRTWIMSFATTDVFVSAQKALNFSAFKYGFKKVISYNDRDILEYRKQNSGIFRYRRGDGLWSWKPYLILKTLEQMPEGDILFYVDSATVFHSDLSSIFHNLDDKNIDMIFFTHNWPEIANKDPKNRNNKILCNGCSCSNNSVWIKRDMMDEFNINKEDFLNQIHKVATLFIIRNTAFTRDFIKKWLKICMNEKLMSPLLVINNAQALKMEHKCFLEHKEDQSALNSLLYLVSKTRDSKKIKTLLDSDFINWNSNKRFFSKHNVITVHTKKKFKKSLLKFLN